MVRMAASKVREAISETLDRVAFHGERIVLQRHGKDEAALVSLADLELLEALEDHQDVTAAREALAEPGVRQPYEEFRREAGLAR